VLVTRDRQGLKLEDAVIAKVGRKWVTVGEGWREQRFDFDGLSDRQWGHPTRMWASREAFEAEQQRQDAWRDLQSATRIPSPPDGVTIADIRAALSLAKGEDRNG
jgi:hypothetical protein